MARRGTSKWFSVQAERRVCDAYGMDWSPSSGASVVSKGDGKHQLGSSEYGDLMVESKHRGSFDKPAKSVSIQLSVLEKLADEAHAEHREPMLHLSIYAPDSPLADSGGYVDVIARLMCDDLCRWPSVL